MAQSFVDANYRYIAAAQEVNARIAQRQQALTLYVSLLVSLLAAMVALSSGTHAVQAPVEWLVLGLAIAALAFTFLNYKSERAITNLRQFLGKLETLDDAHLRLPSYNTEPAWAINANQARRFHDYAASLLVLGGNGIGFAIFILLYPARLAASWPVILAAALLTLFAVAGLLKTTRWRYQAD